MHPLRTNLLNITRRHFFRDCGVGVGKIALASPDRIRLWSRGEAKKQARVVGAR